MRRVCQDFVTVNYLSPIAVFYHNSKEFTGGFIWTWQLHCYFMIYLLCLWNAVCWEIQITFFFVELTDADSPEYNILAQKHIINYRHCLFMMIMYRYLLSRRINPLAICTYYYDGTKLYHLAYVPKCVKGVCVYYVLLLIISSVLSYRFFIIRLHTLSNVCQFLVGSWLLRTISEYQRVLYTL